MFDISDQTSLPAKDDTVNTIRNTAPNEYEATVVIMNELGMHARPAALVAQTAQQYAAEILLITENRQVDAKSILDILSLAAGKGTTITVRGKGNDAMDCIKSITDLVRGQFHEGAA